MKRRTLSTLSIFGVGAKSSDKPAADKERDSIGSSDEVFFCVFCLR